MDQLTIHGAASPLFPRFDTGVIRAYVELTERFAALMAEDGIHVGAYRDDRPLAFGALPPDRQRAVFEHFSSYVEICAGTKEWGHSLKEDRQLLWHAISKFGLRPASDVFAMLGDDDIIEIYAADDFVQIFRNARFYMVCSYTLDEILCRPWFELYRRDPAITQQINETAMRAISSARTEPVHYTTGPHEMAEIDSGGLVRCMVENRFVAPLVDAQNRVRAALNVVRPLSVAYPQPS